MVLETVVDYNFCFPVGCNPPVFFMFILTFMGDAFLFDVTLGDLTFTLSLSLPYITHFNCFAKIMIFFGSMKTLCTFAVR